MHPRTGSICAADLAELLLTGCVQTRSVVTAAHNTASRPVECHASHGLGSADGWLVHSWSRLSNRQLHQAMRAHYARPETA